MLTEWRAAALRHIPDTKDLLGSGEYALGPAAGAALLVFGVGLLAFGKKAAVPAAALAMLAGLGTANYFRLVFDPWWPERRSEGGYVGSAWIPVLYLAALLNGVLATGSGVPRWGAWWLRISVGFVAALVLVPHDLYSTWPVLVDRSPFPFRAKVWPLAAFTLAVALGWAGTSAAARKEPGGVVGLGLALTLFGASFVVIHAHFAKFADVLSIAGAALLIIAIVAAFTRVEVTGATAGVALLLPSALIVAATETYSEVPWYAFALAGLPPLTVGLTAIPPINRATGVWKGVLFWVLCLGPTVAAVILAVRAESLPGAEEWSRVPSSNPC
jgi:hypothetical protein